MKKDKIKKVKKTKKVKLKGNNGTAKGKTYRFETLDNDFGFPEDGAWYEILS
jgi:hypothetical protein